jgi:hypothetical protein
VDRRKRLRLAAESELDVRTIERAETMGISAVRRECDREVDRVEGPPRDE